MTMDSSRALPSFRVRTLADEWTSDSSAIRVTNCDDLEDTGCQLTNANVIFDDEKAPIEYTCDQYLMGSRGHSGGGDGYGDDAFDNIMDYTGTLSETQVSVDYEALIPSLADPQGNERMLQWRVLLAAVQDVGLDRCDFDKQRKVDNNADAIKAADAAGDVGGGGQRKNRMRKRRLDTLALPITLYAIRSDLESSSQFDIPCLNLEPDRDTQECIPVRTVLTLKYQGEESDSKSVQDYVKDLLEQNMVDRTEELYVRDVEGLKYVGTFDLAAGEAYAAGEGSAEVAGGGGGGDGDQPSNIDANDSTPAAAITAGDDDSVMFIGTIVSAASAVALLLFLFVFRRRAHSNQEQAVLVPVKEQDDETDLESGPVTTAPSRSLLSGSYSSDHGTILATSSSADSFDLEPPQPVLSSSRSGEDYADDEQELLMDLGSMKSLSADSSDSANLPVEAHSLPPRPPRRGGGESVKLKKHRKRRKKRKTKPTLLRVNSRENINAMEAILETSDDESDLEESEEGSESYYSTDEEDGDGSSTNRSCSTSSTPVHSQRSASPTTRAGNHGGGGTRSSFFPSNSFVQDFNFVIEALDFPFGRKNDSEGEQQQHKEQQQQEEDNTSSNADNTSPSHARHARKLIQALNFGEKTNEVSPSSTTKDEKRIKQQPFPPH